MGVAVPPKKDNTNLFIGLAVVAGLILFLVFGAIAVFLYCNSSKSDGGFEKGYQLALEQAKAQPAQQPAPQVIREVIRERAPAPAYRPPAYAPPPTYQAPPRRRGGNFTRSLAKGAGWGLGLEAGWKLGRWIF